MSLRTSIAACRSRHVEIADEPVRGGQTGHRDEQYQGEQQRDPGQPAAPPDRLSGGGCAAGTATRKFTAPPRQPDRKYLKCLDRRVR